LIAPPTCVRLILCIKTTNPQGGLDRIEPDLAGSAEEKAMSTEDMQPQSEDTSHDDGKIPKFDLADELMAGHRKVTARRRKAPGKKNQVTDEQLNAESLTYAIGHQMPVSSEGEQVIAEVVARDIKRLCKADSLTVQRRHTKNLKFEI
jgi:hypothetical protein